MKRINLNFAFFVFVFLSVFTYSSSFGQLEKGTFVLKEHFSFSNSTSEQNSLINSTIRIEKSNRFHFNTSFGYLFKDKQEAGIRFGIGRENYEYNNTNYNSSYDTQSKRYGISLYYQKYISLVEKLHFFVSPSVGYTHEINEHTEDNISTSWADTKTNTIKTYINTGFVYNVSQKIGLSINLVGTGIQYSSSKREKEGNYVETKNSFSSSLYDYFGFGGLNLGLQFML